MKKYKVLILIESGDEDDEINGEMEEEVDYTIELKSFNTLNDAATFQTKIAQNKPPEDICIRCGSSLMAGPNGCTICSKDGCGYWRE